MFQPEALRLPTSKGKSSVRQSEYMSIESGAEQPKIVTLHELMSETPVQGIGYERFNERERKDVEALLGRFGVTFEKDSPVIAALRGSTMKDIMEFVKEPVNSERRLELQAEIGEALAFAREQIGEDEDYGYFEKAA